MSPDEQKKSFCFHAVRLLQTGIDCADLINNVTQSGNCAVHRKTLYEYSLVSKFLINILLRTDLIIPVIRINLQLILKKCNCVGNPLQCHSNSYS